MKVYVLILLAVSIACMMLPDAYALGAPRPLTKPSILLITYLTTLLGVLFFMLVQHLIRRSFYSRYKLSP